jgi:hypothetical protein
MWELYKCNTKYWKIYLQNKSNKIPCNFYIDTIGRTKMHLQNKKHSQADKTVATLETIMNKFQIYEYIRKLAKNRRDFKKSSSILGNIYGV